jgi:transmembrane sensor
MKDNYFLAKWLNGEITEDELLKHVSEEELRTYKKIVSTTKNLKTPNFNTEENLEKIKATKVKSKVKKLSLFKYPFRIAAMLAVLISSYYFITNKTTSYTSNLAEKTTFELPDNSKVELNADSEITFKAKNWKNARELNLKGEAFFSVKKGSKFTVNTTLGAVSVLGTKFNVVVRDTYFEVNCYEGLVSVQYNNEVIKVPLGSSFKVLNATSEFSDSNTETKPSWLQNNSSFKSMPYKYVIKELERQFNITIVYDLKNENTLFTGNFTHTNLEMALKAISIPLNLEFKIISNQKVSLY